MALDLSKKKTAKKTARKLAKKTAVKAPSSTRPDPPVVHNDALSPGDTIEVGVTEEVSPSPGRKAWIKFACVTTVRDGETTESARDRLVKYVGEEIDRLIDEL